jgi:ankyrin repeat protein
MSVCLSVCLQLQRTPLHRAAFADCLSVAAILIEHGANVNARNRVRRREVNQFTCVNCLHHWCLLVSIHLSLAVVQDGASPLFWAAHNDSEAMARLLIDHGARVEEVPVGRHVGWYTN